VVVLPAPYSPRNMMLAFFGSLSCFCSPPRMRSISSWISFTSCSFLSIEEIVSS